ncbi:hypothetical protein ACGF1Z_35085 [Streptomyces sp. NPDC048018]|uniref:hypothetical protein n=1 Tax=Streptomyces sp. NPDC048018 TaxID=3365499 RepID=UPI00371CBF26
MAAESPQAVGERIAARRLTNSSRTPVVANNVLLLWTELWTEISEEAWQCFGGPVRPVQRQRRHGACPGTAGVATSISDRGRSTIFDAI